MLTEYQSGISATWMVNAAHNTTNIPQNTTYYNDKNRNKALSHGTWIEHKNKLTTRRNGLRRVIAPKRPKTIHNTANTATINPNKSSLFEYPSTREPKLSPAIIYKIRHHFIPTKQQHTKRMTAITIVAILANETETMIPQASKQNKLPAKLWKFPGFILPL